MKKFIISVLFALPLSLHAQTEAMQDTVAVAAPTHLFGYVSYSTLLESMSDYSLAMAKYSKLEEKYIEESKRVEDDFNAKYEAFLDGQRDFPATILKKRQSELQELLEKNIAFKAESKRLLAEAKAELLKPLRDKLSSVLATLGREKKLAFIINIDDNACPFINPEQGENLSEPALMMLNEQ